ncbi:hypothetical protein [Jiangella endophytica]|uniref:hypothetical protein n=1 Tax=Jiangella endophytica TaxID=1623398 RepID=UPI000E34BBDD|nr:hypothetical protein [Jiangella endophytica]
MTARTPSDRPGGGKISRLKRVTLETTLKPFETGRPDEEVAEELFRQWDDLVAGANGVAILVWVGDGSEILDWSGDLDETFEWARFIGFSNPEQFGLAADAPMSARPYRVDTGPMSYRRLRQIVSALRSAATRHTEEATIGTAFDPGPEFVPSSFKFERHPESGESPLDLGDAPVRTHYRVTCSWSRLDADDRSYAAFPAGIPQGLSFGSFLGAQCAKYFPAVGFDYLWLSNGFGFSFHPWSYRGINFDGRAFGGVDAREAGTFALSFWSDFAAACRIPLEARGTNFPVGVELAKDLLPLRELYRRGHLRWPAPNSPWGALNRNFGVELAGAMSRAASAPADDFPFRFYANDPWFWQNPWRDCYGREPYDIFMPMSVAALRRDGTMRRATLVEILSVDTEHGTLDGRAAREIVPHLLEAIDTAPDRPGPLCWVYPFDELSARIGSDPSAAPAAFFQDWFLANAITLGLPVSSVVASGELAAILRSDPGRLDDTVLIACAATIGASLAEALAGYVRTGGRVLFYGAPADEAVRTLLDLREVPALAGDAAITITRPVEEHPAGPWGTIRLSEACSAGGSGELAGPSAGVVASLRIGGDERTFAVTRSDADWAGGRAAWLRGSLPIDEHGTSDLPQRLPDTYVDPAILVRTLLEDFRIVVRHARTPESVVFHDRTIYREPARTVQFTASRSDNALWLAGYEQDTTASLSLRLPEGAPIAVGQTAQINDGLATYQLDSSFRREVRVYLEQTAAGPVACKEGHPISTRLNPHVRRVLSVSPVVDARIEVHPPKRALDDDRVEVRVNGEELERDRLEPTRHGLAVDGVTGTVEFIW